MFVRCLSEIRAAKYLGEGRVMVETAAIVARTR